jgi:hypothetical protein
MNARDFAVSGISKIGCGVSFVISDWWLPLPFSKIQRQVDLIGVLPKIVRFKADARQAVENRRLH